jgi:hypothetical protein
MGDWVEYCMAEGQRVGEWRPALVVWSGDGVYLNLSVFTDGPNDYLVSPLWVGSATAGDTPGSWRPRCGA